MKICTRRILLILLFFLIENEIEGIIDEFHARICGGHYAWRATAHKILRDGKKILAALPLVLVLVQAPLCQWGLDFIGEIHPPSSSSTDGY